MLTDTAVHLTLLPTTEFFYNVTASSLKMKSNSNAFGTAVFMSGRQGAVLPLHNLSQVTFLMRSIQILFECD